MISNLKCISCGKYYHINRTNYRCDKCNSPLEVNHQGVEWEITESQGVWKYKEIIHPTLPEEFIVTLGEGNTYLYQSEKASMYADVANLHFKHEGRNPTGSFKDRGMTVAVSEAKRQGMTNAICASTGNTSSSAAAYTAAGDIDMTVIIPEGKISRSKLAQAMAYGAHIEEISGNFDNAMERMKGELESPTKPYPLNSINPWRLEGQKTIIFELVEQLLSIDFIAVPSGNLGNISAFGKAIREMKQLGVLYDVPKLIAVQAEGSSPFYNFMQSGDEKLVAVDEPETVASAIRIGNPANWQKAKSALEYTKGLSTVVSDADIMRAKHIIDASGVGCEPASAASLAGVAKLRTEGVIDREDRVACILTGHILKDPDIIMEYAAKDSTLEMLEE